MSVIFSWCWKECGKKFFSALSPIVRLIFKTCFALVLKTWKKNSVYSARYRNKEGFFYNFTVCKCTDRNERMGREAEGKGGGDGWRMEKGRGEEKRGEEERREDCFSTMRTVQNEKFGELATSWCWHLVPYC